MPRRANAHLEAELECSITFVTARSLAAPDLDDSGDRHDGSAVIDVVAKLGVQLRELFRRGQSFAEDRLSAPFQRQGDEILDVAGQRRGLGDAQRDLVDAALAEQRREAGPMSALPPRRRTVARKSSQKRSYAGHGG